MIAIQFIGVIVTGYLLGAIPCGVVLGKLTRGIDVRDYGSGSMGMTNVMRTVGVKAGLIVLLSDILKGAAAVALAWPIFHSAPEMLEWGHMAGGAAAVVGHSWPVYIGFRGGRSVSTAFGALMVISWQVGLIVLAVVLLEVAIFRYISLGSILGGVTAVIAMIAFAVYGQEPYAYMAYTLVVVPILIFRHRGNIKRLLAGTEPKIGQRVKIS
ncbi:MAG: glycerol-3-phosphate 1-O-acyltransferase PlsY [Chloroflexota bacterium]|nr:glycerol-3-phosphate 1-O-acyltransferase PlsY [Chloroflexota bacterium]